MSKIFFAFFLILAAQVGHASETSSSCRQICAGPSAACLKLGLAAKPTYAPYTNLLSAARSSNDGEIANICGQIVMQVSNKISFGGPACDIGQTTLGMTLNTHFPGSTSGFKIEDNGAWTIYFQNQKPEFKFVNQDGSYVTHGEVEFLTTGKEYDGKLIAIWYDGLTCISAPMH